MKTRFSIDVPSGTITRSFGGADVPDPLVGQFFARDILDVEVVFTAGKSDITNVVLADNAVLKLGLRQNTSDGVLLAASGAHTLANNIASCVFDLNTEAIQALVDALPLTTRSTKVYFECEVSAADSSYRQTIAQQQVTLLCEVNMAEDPPPAGAAVAVVNSTHASTNDEGDLTITPTSKNHTEIVAVTGSARESGFVLATAGRSAGDRLIVLLDLTDAPSGIAITPTSGASALLPAGLFPGQVFRTSGIAVPVAFTFVFDGTDWVFVAASDTPTQIKTGGVIIPTNYLGEGTAIDFDFRSNSKTIAADGVTLTASGSPAAGAWTRVEIINSDDESDHAVGIPSSTTLNSTAAITSVTLKAGGRLVLSFEKTASGYNVYGDPPGAVDLTTDVTGVLPKANGGVPQGLDTADKPTFANVQQGAASPTFASSMVVDFATEAVMKITATGNLTLTTANLAAGRSKQVRILSDATPRTLTLPGWKAFGAALPTTTVANKVTRLTLASTGTTDAEVDAVSVQEV